MGKRMLALIMTLVIGACCFVTACGSSTSQLKAEDLYGTWIREYDGKTESYTFNSNKTYTRAVYKNGNLIESTNYAESYRVDENKLYILNSALHAENEYEVTMKGDSMKWSNGLNTVEYTKSK